MFNSPKKYILTRARSLPVERCYITANWQEAGIATIAVARRHTNGHFTIGTYLVDLYCLGVKDTLYYFNVGINDLDKIVEKSESLGMGMKPCDYAVAHNVIYGAVEFAEEYGFKPHKEFSVTKFILEEDDERVELIEYEFGKEGKPCVIVDMEHPQKAVIAQLEKTAGPGNFTVTSMDEMDEEEFDEFDEEEETEINPFLKWTEQDWEALSKGKKQVPKEHVPLLIDMVYREMTKQENMPDNMELAEKFLDQFDITNESSRLGDEMGDEEKRDIKEIVSETKNQGDDTSRNIVTYRTMIRKYPGNPFYYDLLASAYFYSGDRDAAVETIREMMRRFPDDFLARLHCCTLNIEMKNFDAVPSLLDGAIDLEHLPEKRELWVTEMMLYCAVLSHYHLHKGHLQTADIYYQAAKTLHGNYEVEIFDDFIEYTFIQIVTKKAEYMKNKLAASASDDTRALLLSEESNLS